MSLSGEEQMYDEGYEKGYDAGLREALRCAADEIERLRAAVWAAIPWLDDLEHMGSLVDHTRRMATLRVLRSAVLDNEHLMRGI